GCLLHEHGAITNEEEVGGHGLAADRQDRNPYLSRRSVNQSVVERLHVGVLDDGRPVRPFPTMGVELVVDLERTALHAGLCDLEGYVAQRLEPTLPVSEVGLELRC